jgi:hypothetical protein
MQKSGRGRARMGKDAGIGFAELVQIPVFRVIFALVIWFLRDILKKSIFQNCLKSIFNL